VDLGSGAPATESSGAVEQPLPPRGNNPGITVASLPIGGGGGGSSGEGALQCIRVNWILSSSGSAIPAGLAVNITGVTFEPDVYQPAEGPCQGPPCIGFTFKLSEIACDLPIRPKSSEATSLSESEQVTVSAQGRVLCSDYGSSPCKDFAGQVRGSPQTLSVPLPIPPEGRASPTPGSGSGSGPDSGSGSGSGSGNSVPSTGTSANPGN
jgi:hypothetical protein